MRPPKGVLRLRNKGRTYLGGSLTPHGWHWDCDDRAMAAPHWVTGSQRPQQANRKEPHFGAHIIRGWQAVAVIQSLESVMFITEGLQKTLDGCLWDLEDLLCRVGLLCYQRTLCSGHIAKVYMFRGCSGDIQSPPYMCVTNGSWQNQRKALRTQMRHTLILCCSASTF